MISLRLNVVLLVALSVFFITIMLMLKDRKLDLKYALLWLLTWLLLSVLVIFPDILTWFIRLIGIRSNMNGLYIALIGFIFFLLLAIFSIVSGQKERIRKLTEENALLEERIRKLEEEVNK